MKFIVDEYPNYNSDCPFYGKDYHGSCCVGGCLCPSNYENSEYCALIAYEDFMKQKTKGD